MKADAQEPWQALVDSAVILSTKLKQSPGTRELRREARSLLKETYSLERRLGDSSSLDEEDLQSVQVLELKVNRILRSLFQKDEEDFLRSLRERYRGPVYNIGQTIQVTYMVLWALHADRLSKHFLARANWFWERSERAQNGLSGIGKRVSKDEKDEELPRESFELIWRKKRR